MTDIKDILEAIQGREAQSHNVVIKLSTLQEAIAALTEARDKLEELEGHISDICGRIVRDELVDVDQIKIELEDAMWFPASLRDKPPEAASGSPDEAKATEEGGNGQAKA